MHTCVCVCFHVRSWNPCQRFSQSVCLSVCHRHNHHHQLLLLSHALYIVFSQTWRVDGGRKNSNILYCLLITWEKRLRQNVKHTWTRCGHLSLPVSHVLSGFLLVPELSVLTDSRRVLKASEASAPHLAAHLGCTLRRYFVGCAPLWLFLSDF